MVMASGFCRTVSKRQAAGFEVRQACDHTAISRTTHDLSDGFVGLDGAVDVAAVQQADRIPTEPGMRKAYPPERSSSCDPTGGRNVFQGRLVVNTTPLSEDHIMRLHKAAAEWLSRYAGMISSMMFDIGRSQVAFPSLAPAEETYPRM